MKIYDILIIFMAIMNATTPHTRFSNLLWGCIVVYIALRFYTLRNR